MTVQEDEYLAGQAIEAGAYQEAVRLLRPLAERNSEYAFLTLGWIYETGATGNSDKDSAIACYELAAAQGSAPAYLNLGWLFREKGEDLRARAAFEAGLALGSGECGSVLARLDEDRVWELARQAREAGDHDEAVRLLTPLAERNCEYALLALGTIFETGGTGEPDIEAARSCFQRALAQGSIAAYLHLGWLLLAEGEESQARAAYQQGAERGQISCMYRLGYMMVKGSGGPADLEAGRSWLGKAAAQGHIRAQKSLLRVELREAGSLFGKLSVWLKIVALTKKEAREMLRDPQSDKLH